MYVLMNELQICCSIGLLAAAAKSSHSGGLSSESVVADIDLRDSEKGADDNAYATHIYLPPHFSRLVTGLVSGLSSWFGLTRIA